MSLDGLMHNATHADKYAMYIHIFFGRTFEKDIWLYTVEPFLGEHLGERTKVFS